MEVGCSVISLSLALSVLLSLLLSLTLSSLLFSLPPSLLSQLPPPPPRAPIVSCPLNHLPPSPLTQARTRNTNTHLSHHAHMLLSRLHITGLCVPGLCVEPQYGESHVLKYRVRVLHFSRVYCHFIIVWLGIVCDCGVGRRGRYGGVSNRREERGGGREWA